MNSYLLVTSPCALTHRPLKKKFMWHDHYESFKSWLIQRWSNF